MKVNAQLATLKLLKREVHETNCALFGTATSTGRELPFRFTPGFENNCANRAEKGADAGIQQFAVETIRNKARSVI